MVNKMLTHQPESRTPKDVKKLFDQAIEWYIRNSENLSVEARDAFRKIHNIWSNGNDLRDIYRHTTSLMNVINNETEDVQWKLYTKALEDYYVLTTENSGPKGATG